MLLPFVRKAGRYSGNEFNCIKKDWDSSVLRVVLAFPDLYEIGMSHQGLQILYHIINSREDLLAERVYAPDTDLEELLLETGLPLFALESGRAVSEFDMLAITLPYELCYTNILTILSSSGLPFLSAQRDESHPLVFGGGPGAFHPEPVADFFDAILLGDGEEVILEIADVLLEAKQQSWSRKKLLDTLTEIQGVYIPSFFEPRYRENKDFAGLTPLKEGYVTVQRRILASLESNAIAVPLVPLFKIVHDRLGIEVARGCTRGCRFCQAGMIYRPVRERSPEKIMEMAKTGIEATGFEELALLSLSTGDYSCLTPLLVGLMDHFVSQKVSVSLPSMRVGTLTPEVMRQIKRVRKTGFTVAPEAGTDRLRRVINKGITEEDLLATCTSAFALGWKLIKLYFMLGLPTEKDEDIAAIPVLARKALQEDKIGRGKVTVSASTFVPKPHTPFQWEPQLTIDEGYARIDFLKKNLGSKRIQLRWGDPRQSFLEGVMSRGDRRLAGLIIAAWKKGARFDAWSDYFQLQTWRQAAIEEDIDLDRYLRRRAFDEPLPWDHLQVGVDADFFKQEYEKGLAEEYTPDCRNQGCRKCGICDFEEIKPQVCPVPEEAEKWQVHKNKTVENALFDRQDGRFLYCFHYQRRGMSRFISHLELIQLLFRTFRRAKLPLNFSQGFNPSPKISFSPALPLGTESMCEYLIAELSTPLHDQQKWQDTVNVQLPEGLKVTSIELYGKKNIPEKVKSDYLITIGHLVNPENIAAFLAVEEYPVTVTRKKKERKIDARSQVAALSLSDDGKIMLSHVSEISKAALKPLEMVAAIFSLSENDVMQARVLKTDSRQV